MLPRAPLLVVLGFLYPWTKPKNDVSISCSGWAQPGSKKFLVQGSVKVGYMKLLQHPTKVNE